MGILATNSLINYIKVHSSREKPNAISDGEAELIAQLGLFLLNSRLIMIFTFYIIDISYNHFNIENLILLMYY